MRPVRIVASAVLVALAASIAFSGSAPADAHAFTMRAVHRELYPGADVAVQVAVRNPQPYALEIRSATLRIADASQRCAADNLGTTPFVGQIVAPARGRATVPIRLRMRPTAPDACQGATFPLTLSAAAVPVSSAATESQFAATGRDAVAAAALGGAAVVLGLTLLTATRRRRRAADIADRNPGTSR